MATISAPTQLLTFGSTGQTASSVFASSASLTAGRLYVIFCGTTISTKVSSTVSGSSSTWTCVANANSARSLSYCFCVASVTETVTLTVNWADATSGGTTMRLVEVVSSIGWPAAPRDSLPASLNGATGNPTFPASGTLTQASEIAFPAVVAAGNGSLTPTGSTFTNIGSWIYDGSTNGQQAGYAILASTASYLPTGTLAGTVNWRAGQITFLDGAPASTNTSSMLLQFP